ncbi:MAG: hypothetical protein KAW87_07420 [Candidatus Cloacimonetes bacterium]|nr:hypothetical protein [Candidatus Cloacimonadota bacterium]
MRRDFQVSQGYWSLQIPALESIPKVLGLEKSGKEMFKLIDNYMYINRELAEVIGGVLKGPFLLNLAKGIEKGWKTYIGHYLKSSKKIDDIEDLGEISEEEIFNLLSRWQETNIKLLRFHPPSYFTAEALTGALQGFLPGIVKGKERALEITLKLLSGFPEEAKKYRVNYDVWKIANIIKKDKKKREIVLGEDKTKALAALNDLEEFRSFIRNHGHLGDVDPYFPKWVETPEKILDMIVDHVIHKTADPNIVYSKQLEERERITEEITEKLKGNQKTKFIELLSTTQSLYKLYEYEEHSLVRKGLASLRALLLSMGKRLVSTEKLRDVRDVFFLEYKKIIKLRYEPKTEQLASIASERRNWFEDNMMIPACPIVTEEKIPQKVMTEAKKNVIMGLGASRGRTSGIAKIVYNKDELLKVKKGEVLVTPMTFPEFSLKFHLLHGIITDEGGICCHAAVIARELEIPAVVGTRNATRILKDGMKVKLDGVKGIVEFDNSE